MVIVLFMNYSDIITIMEKNTIQPDIEIRTAFLKVIEKHLCNSGIQAYFTVIGQQSHLHPLRIRTEFGSIMLHGDKYYQEAKPIRHYTGYQSWWVPPRTNLPNTYLQREVKREEFDSIPFSKMGRDIIMRISVIIGTGTFDAKLFQLFTEDHRFSGYAIKVYFNLNGQSTHICTLGFSKLEPGTQYAQQKVSLFQPPKKRYRNIRGFLDTVLDPAACEPVPYNGYEIYIGTPAAHRVTSPSFIIL